MIQYSYIQVLRVYFNNLMELWEGGLFVFWKKSVIPQAPKCYAKTKPKLISTQKVPIGLDDLAGAFFLLGFGLGLSTLEYLALKIIYFGCQLQKQMNGQFPDYSLTLIPHTITVSLLHTFSLLLRYSCSFLTETLYSCRCCQ
jgi:hypothetical protein